MYNIINSPNHQQKVFKSFGFDKIAGTIGKNKICGPANIQTANGQLANGFAVGKAISYPLQNPIKNIICYPE